MSAAVEAEVDRLRALIADDWATMFWCVERRTAEDFVSIQSRVNRDLKIHPGREYRVVDQRGMYAVQRRTR